MSGDTKADEKDAVNIARGDVAERLLHEEMNVDAPTNWSPCGSASADRSESAPGSRVGSRRGSATETTWNFVQMNMMLLPIARPLPVTVPSRLHEGLVSGKPRTPNQKRHDRVLRNASHISPRHHEDNMLRRRGSASSENGTTASSTVMPRPTVPARQISAPLSHCGKRKLDHDDQSLSLFDRPYFGGRETLGDDDCRARSVSEDLTTKDAAAGDSALTRSASSSAACKFAHRGALFKDKRILEIQDEARRLVANERAGLASPTKRSRRT